jgi:hypothetical protein
MYKTNDIASGKTLARTKEIHRDKTLPQSSGNKSS